MTLAVSFRFFASLLPTITTPPPMKLILCQVIFGDFYIPIIIIPLVQNCSRLFSISFAFQGFGCSLSNIAYPYIFVVHCMPTLLAGVLCMAAGLTLTCCHVCVCRRATEKKGLAIQCFVIVFRIHNAIALTSNMEYSKHVHFLLPFHFVFLTDNNNTPLSQRNRQR